MKKTKFLATIVSLALVAAGSVTNNASAAIAQVSTVSNPATGLNTIIGFPKWYEDVTGGGGFRLQPCLGTNADGTGLADSNCSLLADPGFDPNLPITAPGGGNFPVEMFYYVADARILNGGPTGAAKWDFRAALEGTFALGTATPGQQTTFLRINLKKFAAGDLTPNSTYTITSPFGPAFSFTTDVTGGAQGSLGNQAFRAQDGGAVAGDFISLLPATTTSISQFIPSSSAPAGYLGNANAITGVPTPMAAGAPNAGQLTISGPDAGGLGVNSVSTNLWTIGGKIAPPDGAPNSITFTPVNPTVQTGLTQQFTSTGVFDVNGNLVPGAVVTWSSSSPAVGTIDPNTGLFTAVSAGTTTITATSGASTGTTTVTVVTPSLTTINVTPANPTIIAGNTQTFSAATLDQFGSPFTATVTWTSSDPAVGTIDPATGLFAAIASGTTTVTATSGAITGTANVTVQAAPILTTINLSAPNSSVKVGDSQQLTVAKLDQFGNPIAANVTFSSSNPSVATVDANGLVNAAGAGTATITATSGSVSGQTTITVNAIIIPQSNISITGISIASKSRSGAVIHVTTSGDSNSFVLFSKTKKNVQKLKKVAQVSDGTSTADHMITLSGLRKKTTYYFKVKAQSPDASQTVFSNLLSFKTLKK